MYASRFALAARRGLRRAPIVHRLAMRLQGTRSVGYEDHFKRAMLAAIRPTDTVWDVGANVGYYTRLFLEHVPAGTVVAVEPAPPQCEAIRRGVSSSRLHLLELALSDVDGTAAFDMKVGENSVLSRLDGAGGTSVRVATIDALVESVEAPAPNLIKIDVEGFEVEVLEGAHAVLRSGQTRDVFVEVHFNALDRRLGANAPSRVLRTLTSAGFKVRWLDPSHLHARRA